MPSTCSQETIEKNELLREMISAEVSKLNYTVSNTKARGLNLDFSRKKTQRKYIKETRKYITGMWIVLPILIFQLTNFK